MSQTSVPGGATTAFGKVSRRPGAARCAAPTSFRGIPKRCGKCPHCRQVNRWLKESFALWEAYGSERTWFVTLTFATKPESEKHGYVEVQKWLKRVRENLDRKKGERIRFIAVTEYGPKTHRLHYHLLLFVGNGVVKRDLPDWPNGHKVYKLANKEAIAYVMKYLTKDGVKYRASQKMGAEIAETIRTHPLAQSVMQAFPGARIVEVRYRGRKTALPRPPQAKVAPTPEDEEFNQWLAKLAQYPSQQPPVDDDD